jgi:Protein of unknown function (DUF2587)
MEHERSTGAAPETVEPVVLDPGERPSGLILPGGEPDGSEPDAGTGRGESVEQPAKVMRIGSMVKQLLEEVRSASLDERSRSRLKEIYEQSVREVAESLSPDLAAELDRMALPFDDDAVPSESELRIAQAQLVGWLEGLFHGIQTALFAQQMAARQQLEHMRQGVLPPGLHSPGQTSGPGQSGTGQYL